MVRLKDSKYGNKAMRLGGFNSKMVRLKVDIPDNP